MKPLRIHAWACAALVVAAASSCTSPPADPPTDEPSATDIDVPRTGDPTTRGFTEADFPRIQEIGPGVYTYEALRSAGEERFTTVSMFVVTDDGVLVADGQGNVEQTRHLVETIATVTDQPITTVVICSDHGDHTAGNSAFPEGVETLAHPTSAAVLRRAAENPSRPTDAPPPATVSRAIGDEVHSLTMGGRTIEVRFLGRAHTGGDLHVYLPEEKILFMSEAYLNRIFPAMRSAYPTEWVDMIERAQALDVDVYVPGHGFVESPAILAEELETYRQAVVQVIAEATRLHEQGLTVEQAIEAADFGDLDTWSLRSSQGPTAIRRIFMELNGELPSS